MSVRRVLSAALAAAGLVTVAAALGWWWVTYREVYSYNYLSLRQAGLCLIGDGEICRLATSLCRGKHASFALVYSSSILWVGVALLSVSLVVPSRISWMNATERQV